VDIERYESGESNVIGHNRNCFTTVVLGITVQVYGVTVIVKWQKK